MPTKQPSGTDREPVPFDDVLRRLLAAPPAPKVAPKRKPKANKRTAKPRQ